MAAGRGSEGFLTHPYCGKTQPDRFHHREAYVRLACVPVAPEQGISRVPIELEDHGFYGRVRQGGEPGHRLPDLIAHRPERWRFKRLADVVEQARMLAAEQLGETQAAQMIDAIEYICDAKGDFTVLWRQEGHRQDYETFVTRALHEMGEDEIVHEITVSPKA